MEQGVKRIYHLLHNELDRVKNKDLDLKKIYIEHDGELLPFAESVDAEKYQIIEEIKKKNAKNLNFVMMWQKSQKWLCENTSGNAFKLISYMISELKFDNAVYGISYRKIAKEINISTRTVTRAVKELEDIGAVKVTGKKGNKVYHINPALAWKGAFHTIAYKLKMFDDKMKIEGLWKK